MYDPVDFVISTFISILFFITGFILGEIQSKKTIHDIGDDVSETILEALKLSKRTNLDNVEYNRKTRNFMINNPDSTTSTDE